jgi:hypothetical protein
MFWFYFAVALIIVGLFLLLVFMDGDLLPAFGAFFLTVGIIAILTCGIGGMIFYSQGLGVEADSTKLQASLYQRDQLVDLVKDELSAEQFGDLMQATSEAEVKLIFSGSSVSDVLITRANEIVKINRDYLDRYSRIVNHQISTCNNMRNVFVPRLPWLGECNYDLVTEVPDRVEVYNG